MLILFISDGPFGRREQRMLRRLEVGLLDEGVRVLRAFPASIGPAIAEEELATHFVFQDAGPRIMRSFRLRQLVEQLSEVAPAAGSGHVDVVHAWGGGCWLAARELALAADATLLLEVWSGRSLDRANRFERESGRTTRSRLRGAWSLPGEAMLKALRRRHPTWPIYRSRWGIHKPSSPPVNAAAGRPLGIAIIATGVDQRAVAVMLDGLARAIGDGMDVLIFLDEASVARHAAIWKRCETLGLTNRLSVVADMESRRELTLDMDIVVQPEALGEHRTILLEAMGAGCVVLAQADPLCEYLIDGETALLVQDPTAPRWQAAFERTLSDENFRSALGESASRYVSRDRLAHMHIQHLLEAYQQLAAAEPLQFKS